MLLNQLSPQTLSYKSSGQGIGAVNFQVLRNLINQREFQMYLQ